MSTSGDAITGAANDLGSGLTGLAQVSAGALLLLLGLLLVTGWSKPVTRAAVQVAQALPMGRAAKALR